MNTSTLQMLRNGAYVACLCLTLGLTACGGDSETLEPDTLDVKSSAANSSVTQTINLVEGESLALRVEATIDGNTTDVTNEANWSSSNTAVAAVDSTGRLRANNPGLAEISAEYRTLVKSFSVRVEKAPCVVQRIDVVGTQSPRVDDAASYSATAICSDSTRVENPTFIWSSSDTTKLTINDSGIARAHSGGMVTVMASYGGVTGRLAISIESLQTLSLEIVSTDLDYPAEFCVGESVNLIVRNEITGQFVTGSASYSVDDATVVSHAGINLTALKPGETTVRATAGIASGSLQVTVPNCEPDVPDFDGLIFRAKSADGWNTINIYAWDESNGITKYAGDWPGTPMEGIGDGWFEYRMEGIYSSNVIFNNGAGSQTTDMLGLTESGWCSLSGAVCTWTTENPDNPPQPSNTISVSPAGGSFTDTVNVTFSWVGNEITGCVFSTDGTNPSLNNGSQCSNGQTVNLGQSLAIGQTLQLQVCDQAGKCEAFVYRKTEQASFDWNNSTVYFVVTDRFNDGNASNNNSYGRESNGGIGDFHGGDVKGLTNKLNEGYFTDLGVTAIWITAPYEQVHGWVWGTGQEGSFHHYGYHGYYPLDYTVMDKNMGTKAEFKEFVDTAHRNGIRVVMDIVMNHAGYATVKDMQDFNIDVLNGTTIDWDSNNWVDWWGPDWIRAGLGGGYADAGCGIDECPYLNTVDYLPDFKTESNNIVGLPPFLQRKSDTEARQLNTNVRGYLISWLTDWVREYGIDGFRADTVKHVEPQVWNELKQAATAAYEEYKQSNGGSPLADDLPFWMTGEYWNHNASSQAPNGQRYQDVGFDSMINFDFKGAASGATSFAASIDSVYNNIQNVRNSGLGLLNYLSSHDTSLFFNNDANRQKMAGSLLLMAPGPAQIFYGDETGRAPGPDGGVPMQATRTFMNWNNINNDILTHWQKLGQFRRDHVAIGAGQHRKISDTPYAFSRSTNDDKVVVVLGATANQSVTVNVQGIFANGATVNDAYNGGTATVSGGSVTLNAGPNGTLLLSQ